MVSGYVQTLKRKKLIDMKTARISNLLRADAAKKMAVPAFVQNGKLTSLTDFAEQVDRMASWLRERSIKRGDVIALWLVNSVEWIALFAAAARIGAIVVSVNTRYRSAELAHILSFSNAKILFTHCRYQNIHFLEILSSIEKSSLPNLCEVVLVNESLSLKHDSSSWPLSILDLSQTSPLTDEDISSEDDPVILFSTSGTTSAPKLVMHSQRTLVDHANRCAISLELNKTSVVMLAMLPMCGVFGLVGVLAAMAGCARIVIQETFDAEKSVALLINQQVTHTFGSDEMYRRISDLAKGDTPFPHARFFGFGAFTSSFDECAQQCVKRGMPLHGLYGSSEVLALFSAQPTSLQITERLMGGGLPMACEQASVRVRDTATGKLLPVGVSGEIEIRAPSNFLGYFRNRVATAQAMQDDYFKTGDLGYLRTDGTFVYESRIGDSMRLGGHLVNPVEIEEIIKRVSGVVDTHVVAADIDGQTRAVAFLIPVDSNTFDVTQMNQQLKKTIAGFKIPVRVWLVDSFPQTQGTNGLKTSRDELRKIAKLRIATEKNNEIATDA